MSSTRHAAPVAGYRLAASGPRGRYESPDGKRLLDVQVNLQGARDFQAAILRAAQALSKRPALHEACVAVRLPRLSNERIRQEWEQVRALLHKPIAERLALIVLHPKESWAAPEDSRLAKVARQLGARSGVEERNVVAHSGSGRKVYEVLKVLVDHWLRRHGPVSISQLMHESGCSYPTVAECVERLKESREAARRSNRSVELVAFPRRMWNELLTLRDLVRPGLLLVDASGHAPDPRSMLQRLAGLKRDDLALGGVYAARHYDRHFDLHGTPRIDVCMHAPAGITDLDFARRLDPALAIASGREEVGVLAVHLVTRPAAGFEPSQKGLPWASRVETLLDLHELRLTEQAEDLVSRLTRSKERT